MNDTIPKGNKEKKETIDAIVSAENNRSDDCECNDKDYTFEISEDCRDGKGDQEFINTQNVNHPQGESKVSNNGEIVVTSILECEEHECLQGVKINLYKINGLSPVLIKSKITDEEGNAIFSEIEEGCYRIIEIIDKRYFEKPKYINWNEIIIDSTNKNQKIMIINKIKKSVSQNKHKHWA